MKDNVFDIIRREARRQGEQLQMIPSENYVSQEVRQAVGSVMMNKYSEGQVSKRYYQGNENMDAVERICKERALKVFGLDDRGWGVNVQPHSGCEANLAVYNALLQPGERIMSMFLPDGGHLSHGWEYKGNKVTLVSKIWNVSFYHVDRKTRVFDYDKIERQAMEFKPKLLISGGTAYPREIDHRRMGMIARKVEGYYMADIAHEAGLIVGGVNQSPFPYADAVTFTTHKTLRGPRGAVIFSRRGERRGGSSVDLAGAVDRSVFPGLQGGPHNHTIAGIAVAFREAGTKKFRKYAEEVVLNAKLLAKRFKEANLDVVSGGTDKHLILLDLRNRQLSGWVAAWALEYTNIIVNRNTVPYETESPYYPSGLRLGTPAITTRGMQEKEMEKIAAWIIDVISYCDKWRLPRNSGERSSFVQEFRKALADDRKLSLLQKEVRKFCLRFPVPD